MFLQYISAACYLDGSIKKFIVQRNKLRDAPIRINKQSKGCIQRETLGMIPYAGTDYNLTLSHSRLRRGMFPQLSANRKGDSKGRGRVLKK
jgi:hypothetical protein